MNYVKKHIFETLIIKQSKFIAHIMPYDEYAKTLKDLKNEHTKARHFVVAWRYVNEYDQVVEHCSDDGEPKGTSGKPTLAVLAGQGLINSAIIIVRYFGGTKLGTGGLVRAYSQACNGVIEKSTLEAYVKLEIFVFEVKYADISLIEYQLNEDKALIQDKSFNGVGALISVLFPKEIWDKFAKEHERLIKIQI